MSTKQKLHIGHISITDHLILGISKNKIKTSNDIDFLFQYLSNILKQLQKGYNQSME